MNEKESKGARPEAVRPSCDLERGELRTLIDEEIRRLPEKYRRPVVLCYLEGRTHEEAARRLRCSEGSVRGRLDRARAKLRDRLIRRGVAPAAGLSAVAAGSEAVSAPMLAGAVATLARADTATTVSGTALELAVGVLRGMALARVTRAAALIVGIVAIGAIPMIVAMGPGAPRASDSRPASSSPARGPGQGITLLGRVLDESGKPIAGARVARGADLRYREDVPEATTGGDGRFAMPDVPPGRTVLTVQAPGHAPDLKSLAAGPDSPPVEFRLGPGHTFRGRILDTHEKPIAGVPVAAGRWRRHDSLRWETRTDAEGRFRWDDAPTDRFQLDLGSLDDERRPDFPRRTHFREPYRVVAVAPEMVVTMPRPLRVRGRVTDAETGRPIELFTLVAGWSVDKGGAVTWEYPEGKEIHGPSYDVPLMAGSPFRVIQIDADGYRPGLSRPLRSDEEDIVVDFALRRGPLGVSGIVRLPDGSPLAGAPVLLSTPANPVRLRGGPRPYIPEDHRIDWTRGDGRFRLPPQEPPYTIAALHDRGYALLDIDAHPSAPPELTIRPWGRIEGSLRIGGRPGATQALGLERAGQPSPSLIIRLADVRVSDAQGRFTFDRVMPGEVRISRMVPFGPTSSFVGGSPSAVVDVAPGATSRPTLGGKGRPIIGRAVLPAEFAGRGDWMFGVCDLIRQPAAAEVESGPGRRAGGDAIFRVEPDGSFRIDEIESGTYELQIHVSSRPDEGVSLGSYDRPQRPVQPLAWARRPVIVPPIPAGHSDEPMDLGDIRLITEPTAGAAPDAPKP